MSDDGKPERGQVYEWPSAADCQVTTTVTRVARDGSWADVQCSERPPGRTWRKRQPTPIPGERKQVES